MGNLRQKFTDKEWEELSKTTRKDLEDELNKKFSKIIKDFYNGKK